MSMYFIYYSILTRLYFNGILTQDLIIKLILNILKTGKRKKRKNTKEK